ncbi:MAG: DarT ssDNA thymidine ADP-ribosyltransferase family protein [Thermodesulfobacteriota bacterium]
MDSKLDYESLKPFLEDLPAKLKLHKGGRSLWPHFVYHSTEVHNTVSILKKGYVYSRNKAKELGLLEYDIASESVISSTRNEIKDYVRFYFRPRTPTQYRNEGIRPVDSPNSDAHCPIPVYLLFDSVEVLSIESTRFSDGNLGSFYIDPLHSVKEFKNLPFELIYHVGAFPNSERDRIINCRNAEVIVPEKLSTDYLRLIYCRSDAEKDTLLNLMPTEISNIWSGYIKVDDLGQLFYKEWTFIDIVRSYDSKITLYFSPETKTPGPFEPFIELYDLGGDLIESLNYKKINCNKVYNFPFKNSHAEYMIKVFLSGILAYQGYHIDYDLPF